MQTNWFKRFPFPGLLLFSAFVAWQPGLTEAAQAEKNAGAAPACKPSDISIEDPDIGDAGASNQYAIYFLAYGGSSHCQVRGYPTISVHDASGKPLPRYAQYSDEDMFTSTTGVRTVVLSSKEKKAWFMIHTASGCEQQQPNLTVKVGLPDSQNWIRNLSFPYATCPVSITPIRAMSTLQRP